MTAEVHLNDEGTKIRVIVHNEDGIMDLTSAITKQFLFRKKNKQVFARNADFETSGSDGVLIYTSGSADFDLKGNCDLQLYLELPSGKWHTDVASFEVAEIFTLT